MIQYEHYGRLVWVDENLKGKHRDHCLCWKCGNFFPEDREKNCKIAQLNYQVCVAFDVVLPVYECPIWKPKT
jgi:hypothetical protein